MTLASVPCVFRTAFLNLSVHRDIRHNGVFLCSTARHDETLMVIT